MGLLCYDARHWEELLLPTDFMEATEQKNTLRASLLAKLPADRYFRVEGMYRYDVARRVLTHIHVQQQLKGIDMLCFIQYKQRNMAV